MILVNEACSFKTMTTQESLLLMRFKYKLQSNFLRFLRHEISGFFIEY